MNAWNDSGLQGFANKDGFFWGDVQFRNCFRMAEGPYNKPPEKQTNVSVRLWNCYLNAAALYIIVSYGIIALPSFPFDCYFFGLILWQSFDFALVLFLHTFFVKNPFFLNVWISVVVCFFFFFARKSPAVKILYSFCLFVFPVFKTSRLFVEKIKTRTKNHIDLFNIGSREQVYIWADYSFIFIL